MKKKNLKRLPFKKKVISTLVEKYTRGGQFTSVNDTGCCNHTNFFCPSEQTCQTFNIICRTAFLCGTQNPGECNDSLNFCF